jgi:EAL domain-containing protein (putative c-di-GMP-specific phosphodiesterase class I)/cellulose synthase/poly-beta-1,6-N-acetylglucosamine synthase-like glycosyltransferase
MARTTSQPQVNRMKRQIGSDRMRQPLPPVPRGITERRVILARLAIVITIVGWITYLIYWFSSQFLNQEAYTLQQKFLAIVYLAMVTLLIFASVAYLTSRLGYLYRVRQHRRIPRAVIDQFFDTKQPTLTAIVPSYREETRVIRSTLLSVALQEYPDIEIVLLIDDPPEPTDDHNRALLQGARELPGDLERLLAYPRAHLLAAQADFERGFANQSNLDSEGMIRLGENYDFAVSWLELQASSLPIEDHTDVFLKQQVFERLAADFSMMAVALREAAQSGDYLSIDRARQLYARLVNTFTARLTSFERKRYVSLSHEANKAMNLNSYLGLMGGAYCDVVTLSGRTLVPTEQEQADLVIRDPDYVLTLDADSTLLPEYCLRLVHLLEQDEFADVGVTQTPYSAYPGAGTRLERIAGATTDIQHIVHQGLTNYSASFWVGANAVIRKTALEAVESVTYEGGYPIRRYVSDRTAIEDTESSIDLVSAGWKIYNYPERLSYSATPPDFGSLAIQRRRWADGGLLILPKLRRRFKGTARKNVDHRFGEFALRTNYLASITWTSVALVILLIFPFANQLVSPYLALLALPYFWAMSTDLKYSGYRRLDILRIYGFNLILIPVNLAGTASSLVQALTGEHGSFMRTPKVKSRTVAPFLFVVAPYVLIALTIYTLIHDYYSALWNNAVFAIINLVLASYAVVAYIGIRHSIQDIFVQIRPIFARRQRRKKELVGVVPSELIIEPRVADWESVLYYGPSEYLLDTQEPSVKGREKVPSARLSPGTPRQIKRSLRRSDAVAHPAGDHKIKTFVQPVLDLESGVVVGYEILNRINGASPVPYLAGLDAKTALAVEGAMLANSLGALEKLPSELWISVNVSHRFLIEGDTNQLIRLKNRHGEVFFEISGRRGSESDSMASLAQLMRHFPVGLQVAIDDTVPEYNSLQLFSSIRPQMIKIDRSWVKDIDRTRVHQSLTEVTVRFAAQSAALVIAEGIETERELDTLKWLGIRFGQGYLFAKPLPLDEFVLSSDVPAATGSDNNSSGAA